MKVVGVIPARYASTRLPGKPLVKIAGKPLLQWVIEGARGSQKIDEIIVATDHSEIASLANSLGVEAVMTDPELPSGSDRVWAAVANRPADIVINIQGDEPLITGSLLDCMIAPFVENEQIDMVTLGRGLNLEDLHSSNTAKIVLNKYSEALYFSRFPIPYSRSKAEEQSVLTGCLKHIGMYAYRKQFLESFCQCSPVAIEQGESLEQLRALYLGAKIKVVKVEHDSWGVDTPEDIGKIEKILSDKGS